MQTKMFKYAWMIGNGIAIALIPFNAVAQVTINSTGTVSGTITPPSRNPNFNQGTTRVDTDSQGRYFRNGVLVFSAQDINPNLVRMDSNGRYFVDFRGIPVVSTDGTLLSPVLSNGELQLIQRSNNVAPVKFHGNIQDEFVVQGQYTGTATDPQTGQQYQGTFNIRGQGPRYSDRNGGSSPTVFDFRSQYNLQATPQIAPQPTVFSYPVNNMPVQLTITIPSGLAPISPSGTPPISNPPLISNPLPISNLNPVSNPISISNPATNSVSQASPIDVGSVYRSNQFFEVNRVVLEFQKASPVGPRSRVLLR
ncbi:hypothetical protein [Phormidesmis sp. 146-33]